MEPLAILVLSVIMSSASGMVIIRSAETIQVSPDPGLLSESKPRTPRMTGGREESRIDSTRHVRRDQFSDLSCQDKKPQSDVRGDASVHSGLSLDLILQEYASTGEGGPDVDIVSGTIIVATIGRSGSKFRTLNFICEGFLLGP